MRKSSYIAAIVLCACGFSCSTEAPYAIPDIAAGDRPEAVEEQLRSARSWAEQNPDSADALGRFGMVLQAYGMYEEAVSAYGRARQLAPKQFRWAYLHGFALDVLGRDAAARDAFAAAAGIDGPAGSTALGAALVKVGETDKARATLLESLGHDDQDARALYELGRLEGAAGNLAEAENYLSRSLAAGVENPSVYYTLADIAKRQGDEAQAAEYQQRFTAIREQGNQWPDRWLAEVAAMRVSEKHLMDAAVRAIQNGDIAAAIEFNEQAREVNPDNPLPAAALIGLYAITGDNDKSDAILPIARALDPDSAQFHYNVGLARMAQNKLAEAVEAMQRVIEIDPQGSLAWVKLGEIYAAQGNRDKAIDAFANAYERAPADQGLRLRLGVLYIETQRFEAGLDTLQAPAVGDQYEARRLWAVGRAHRHLGNAEQAANALAGARDAAVRVGDLRLASAVAAELERLNAPSAN